MPPFGLRLHRSLPQRFPPLWFIPFYPSAFRLSPFTPPPAPPITHYRSPIPEAVPPFQGYDSIVVFRTCSHGLGSVSPSAFQTSAGLLEQRCINLGGFPQNAEIHCKIGMGQNIPESGKLPPWYSRLLQGYLFRKMLHCLAYDFKLPDNGILRFVIFFKTGKIIPGYVISNPMTMPRGYPRSLTRSHETSTRSF